MAPGVFGFAESASSDTLAPLPNHYPPLCLVDAMALVDHSRQFLTAQQDGLTSRGQVTLLRMIDAAFQYVDIVKGRHSTLVDCEWIPLGRRTFSDASWALYAAERPVRHVLALAFESSGRDVSIKSVEVVGGEDETTTVSVTVMTPVLHDLPWNTIVRLPEPMTTRSAKVWISDQSRGGEVTVYLGILEHEALGSGRRAARLLSEAGEQLRAGAPAAAEQRLTDALEAMKAFNRELIKRQRPRREWIIGRTRWMESTGE